MSDKSKRFSNLEFGDRFKSLLKQTNEQALAENLGIQSTSTFRQWTNGYTLPTCENLLKLSEFFGVTCDFILGKAECKTADNESIRKVTGLTDSSIEQLRKLQELHEVKEISAINSLLENSGEMPFFRRLWDYLHLDFSKEDEYVSVKSDTEKDERKERISAETLNAAVRVELIDMLSQLK